LARRRKSSAVAAAVALSLFACAAPAQAAKSCAEPGSEWERATPAEAGMDAAKLQSAIDYGSSEASFAVRVYRHGCLVGEDRLAAVNRHQQFQSWSMAKSITSVIFGRAMTRRLIGPDDPVGSLLPEADAPHGAITARHLLTMSSGLHWNGFRDYNIFTQQDRVNDALTLPVVHRPGTYFEYAQSAVALLAEQVGRAVGEDFQAFGQREVMDPLGIAAGSWRWERDSKGHVQGFYGVHMRPDDYGRLGELMRRNGLWRGSRLLGLGYMRQAVTPARTNGCYGFMHWLNAGEPCVGARVQERPIVQGRDFPDLPPDLYRFSGLFGQLVTIFPSQGIVLVRTGHEANFPPGGESNWEHELYTRVLGAITDQPVPSHGPKRDRPVNPEGSDHGFQQAITRPNEYSQGSSPPPLPPAGPARARAVQLTLVRWNASRRGVVLAQLHCPPRWPSSMRPGCRGRARLQGARRARRYRMAPGTAKTLRFRLTARRLRALRRRRALDLVLAARNADAAGGALARRRVLVRRPR
jgi:CubicO group peptidase (beta-lactamase class C family)